MKHFSQTYLTCSASVPASHPPSDLSPPHRSHNTDMQAGQTPEEPAWECTACNPTKKDRQDSRGRRHPTTAESQRVLCPADCFEHFPQPAPLQPTPSSTTTPQPAPLQPTPSFTTTHTQLHYNPHPSPLPLQLRHALDEVCTCLCVNPVCTFCK